MRQCIPKSTSSLVARGLHKALPTTSIVQQTARKHLAAPTILDLNNKPNTPLAAHRRAFTTTARMSAIQNNVEAASAEYSATFKHGHLPLPPGKHYLVLTCMDARIDPARAFGIEVGDAHVIRNAGASAVDALRSIVISQQLLATNEIVLVKHTGCGMLTFKHEDGVAVVDKNLGKEAVAELSEKVPDFLPFGDVEKAVEEDVRYLKESKLVPEGVAISGWVYEVETGKTRRVV